MTDTALHSANQALYQAMLAHDIPALDRLLAEDAAWRLRLRHATRIP